MAVFDTLREALPRFLPLLAAVAAVIVVLLAANWVLLRRRSQLRGEGMLTGQIIMLILTGTGIVLIVLAMPVSDATQGQLLTLLGVAAMATIALSSTTFASNAMAGLMLRAVRSFRPGDFVRVGDQFGRVTERGLFHTEIQTEYRDLTTLPNLYLVSNPITVVRSSGTIVSSTVSLGYDIPRAQLEALLTRAAEKADLTEPFVQITELGDYAVTYRVAGFLSEVKHLVRSRSTLRKRIMDTLHDDGIEIVSPMYMNQRAAELPSIPKPAVPLRREAEHGALESLMFDKAEKAQLIADLQKEREQVDAEIKDHKDRIGRAGGAERAQLEAELTKLHDRMEAVTEQLRVAADQPASE